MQQDHFEEEKEFSFKSLFLPLTTLKAIHWIIIIGLVVYANMLFNGFVWDDFGYIINNPLVHSINLVDIFSKNTFNDPAYHYIPVTVLYFASVYSFAGSTPFLYHFLQLTLHIVNTILIFFVFKKFFEKRISLILCLIFLIHPMNVESVSYMSSTIVPLSFLLGIITFLISMKENVSIKNYIVIFLLMILSLLTEETSILFMVVIVLYAYLFNPKNSKGLFLVEAAASIFYFFIRISAIGISTERHQDFAIIKMSLLERIINIPKVIFYYIHTFFYPDRLYIDQRWFVKQINIYDFYLPLVIVIIFLFAISMLGIYVKKSYKEFYKPYVLFLCWFVLGLVILLHLFPLDMTVADRWIYFPMVGLLGMVGICFSRIEKYMKVKFIILPVVIVVCILLSGRTMIRNENYHDEVTLFTHDAKIENNYELEVNLGGELFTRGDTQNAIVHLRKSIELFPYEINFYNLGYVYEKTNNIEEAKRYYSQALHYYHFANINHLHYLGTYEGMGRILLATDTPENTVNFLKKALQDYPDAASLWTYLAIGEYKLNNQDQAFRDIKKARELLSNPTIEYIYNQITAHQPIDLRRVY